VQHHPTVPPDGDPYVTTTPTDGTTISALCLVGRCATCKGAVLSLVHPVGTRCTTSATSPPPGPTRWSRSRRVAGTGPPAGWPPCSAG
jgi:hypothetical protein